ncbi:sulfotransferase family 2 domain-containing protein [bacterium]|nr:sulfotransferase family 2 domain-containing protein [bacterium]
MVNALARSGPLLIMHIPKTAGTSLRWVAEQQYPGSEFETLYPCHAPQIEAFLARPAPPAAVIGHFRFGLHARLGVDCRYVTFLRDPVDQVVSHFNYIVAGRDPDSRGTLGPADRLEDFLAHDWARNLQTQFVCGWSADQVAAAPRAALERAKQVLSTHFVGVGLVESFGRSLRKMAPRLGWHFTHIPRLNPAPNSVRAIRRRSLGASAIREIDDANSCDRELYEYVRRRHCGETSVVTLWAGRAASAASWLTAHLR